MNNKILPIGSVVSLIKNKNVELMIVSYFNKEKEYNNEKYDYICCVYPFGLSNDLIFIRKEDIFEIKFIGYQNGKFVEFKKILGVEQ